MKDIHISYHALQRFKEDYTESHRFTDDELLDIITELCYNARHRPNSSIFQKNTYVSDDWFISIKNGTVTTIMNKYSDRRVMPKRIIRTLDKNFRWEC